MKANKLIFTIVLLSSFATQALETPDEGVSDVSNWTNYASQYTPTGLKDNWKKIIPAACISALLHFEAKRIANLPGVGVALDFLAERALGQDVETKEECLELLDAIKTHAGIFALNKTFNMSKNGQEWAAAGTAAVLLAKKAGTSKGSKLSHGALTGFFASMAFDYLPEKSTVKETFGL